MSSPLVSVIIVSHNHEKYILKCVESIIKQTYKKIEILAFDNGSEDNSGKIITQLSNKYKFFYKLQKNIGISNTLNDAIKNYAKGKYIAPIAGDDFWLLDKIENQVNIMEKEDENVAVCTGNIILVDEYDKPYPKQYMNNDFILDFETAFLRGNGICAPTALIRKSVFNKIGYYDSSLSIEDYDMWLRILYKGYKIINVSKIYAYYRQHRNNLSLNLEFMNKDNKRILYKYVTHPQFRKALQNYYLRQFLFFSKHHKKKALNLIPKVMFRLNKKFFLKGLIYLFTPKNLLKKYVRFDQRMNI
ncbi:MAG: glycosyltransferase [Candidatus Cloacimonetes bacterium]|nr:glycosyltransferase [Candidatus Cloacimonadota bacterium]